MPDEAKKLQELFSSVRPAWTPQRAADAERGIHRRLRRRARVRVALAVGSLGVLALVGAAQWQRREGDNNRDIGLAGGAVDHALRLPDGSVAVPLDEDSEVALAEM